MRTLSIGHLTYDINMIVDNYPVEGSKNITKEIISCSGGSANIVAYALAKWNEDSYISGVVGYDDTGNSMRKDMDANKVLTAYLETNYDIKTPVSYIISNKNNNSKTYITSETNQFFIKKYEYDQHMDCVISDGTEYNATIYAYNKYANGVTILNAKTPRQKILDFFKYAKYVVASSNVAEAITGIKMDFNNPMTMATIYKKILDKYPNIILFIRIEGKGTIYQINGEIKILADIQKDVIDYTGAHDIYVACISYGLVNQYDIETTIRLATIASSMSKEKLGSTLSIPIFDDIVSYYENKFGKLNKNNINQVPENNPETVEDNVTTTE